MMTNYKNSKQLIDIIKHNVERMPPHDQAEGKKKLIQFIEAQVMMKVAEYLNVIDDLREFGAGSGWKLDVIHDYDATLRFMKYQELLRDEEFNQRNQEL